MASDRSAAIIDLCKSYYWCFGKELRQSPRSRAEPCTNRSVLHSGFSKRGPANVLTLSCKDRPPCRPSLGGAAAAATNAQRRERTAADVTPPCSSSPPRRLAPHP